MPQAAARSRRAGAALIDQHDSTAREIEACKHAHRACTAGPAVQDGDGYAVVRARDGKRDAMAIARDDVTRYRALERSDVR
jgi:hypothetical protein